MEYLPPKSIKHESTKEIVRLFGTLENFANKIGYSYKYIRLYVTGAKKSDALEKKFKEHSIPVPKTKKGAK